MTYQPTPAQQAVIDADDPVLLVLGGAGTGKTSTAAAAVRAWLERRSLEAANGLGIQRSRALFLSFSRAAVAQILDRTAGILGTCKDQVEITTYHAFAWSLIERFGSAVGLPNPVLATEAEVKLFQPAGAIRYRDMVPLALRLCRVPAIAAHLRSRWRGERQWRRAARLLRPLVARSARHATSAVTALTLLDQAVSRQRASLLTYAADADPVPVQLMGLYQTKGPRPTPPSWCCAATTSTALNARRSPSGPGCCTSCSPAPATRPSCSSSATASLRGSRRLPIWRLPGRRH